MARKLVDITKEYVNTNRDCLEMVHNISKELGKKVVDAFDIFQLEDKTYLDWYKENEPEVVNAKILELTYSVGYEIDPKQMFSGDIILFRGFDEKIFICYYIGNLNGLIATFDYGIKNINLVSLIRDGRVVKVIRLRNANEE